jgi:hypothetical protein
MLNMVARASDRLASKFVKRINAGACYAEQFCYCYQEDCPKGAPCGEHYSTNCAGTCVRTGYC